MRVKEVERITGVRSHTIRYYSRLGLLAPQRNPTNQYREFDTTDIDRLLFIRQAKALGFGLQEIELILRSADEGVASAEVRGILLKRSEEIHVSLIRLETLRNEIEIALDSWTPLQGEQMETEVLRDMVSAFARISESRCTGKPGEAIREAVYRRRSISRNQAEE